MTLIFRATSAFLVTALLGACTLLGDPTREFRLLEIADQRLRPSVIYASADKRLTLEVELIAPQEVSVSIPTLGVGTTVVPANQNHRHSVDDTAAGHIHRARIELGLLNPGEYPIICDCPWGTVTARIVIRGDGPPLEAF